MRYDDWDVLVMPLGSHIPIPEFRVEAYPVDDIEAPPINSIFNFTSQADPASLAPAAPPDTPPNSSGGPNLQIPLMYAQIPLLSCFVPSQPEGTAFKVSIHRWEQIPFNLDPVTISMTGRIPCCEIRVFVDGNLVSDGVIKPDTIWPIQIGTSYSNPKLNRGYLRWPKFHEGQLSQSFWSPGEDHGRIKVVISEGIMYQATGCVTRTRNLVSFAFQHAPFEILQGANIAWPSERLWLKSVPNNTETNLNQSVVTTSENGNHEAAQNQPQPSNNLWDSKVMSQDLNATISSFATETPPSQAFNETTTTQASPTKSGTNQPNLSADKTLTGLYTPTSPTNNHNNLPWITGSITAPLPNTVSFYYIPTQAQFQGPSSPPRKKHATELNINHSTTTEQAATKAHPSNKAEVEKVPARKVPAKRTCAAKNVKSATTRAADDSLNAKPPSKVRKASAQKKTTSPRLSASSDKTRTEKLNVAENTDSVSTTAAQNDGN